MNELNDKDWEQVNAYHDGELCAADMRAFEGRPASEPALAAALEDVRNVSVSLAALRPDLVHSESMPETSAANSSWHPRRWLAGGAVAAGIALAVVFGPAFVATPTAFDIHAELAAEMYDAARRDRRCGGRTRPVRRKPDGCCLPHIGQRRSHALCGSEWMQVDLFSRRVRFPREQRHTRSADRNLAVRGSPSSYSRRDRDGPHAVRCYRQLSDA